MPADYFSELLHGGKHDRGSFPCGDPDLDRYFKEQATQDYRRKLAVPHVLVEAATGKIVGFHTLSMRSIARDSFPPEAARRLSYRQIPVALIGRLAVHRDYQGKGWGWKLLADALARILSASSEVAAYAVVVEAKNDSARSFYEHGGFRPFADNPRMLYIPVDSITEPPAS